MEKTAVIYCRVSTVRQAEEELPIQSQQQRCEDKARALDATVSRVYSDEGLSGQSGDRPAFQQAILYCETHSPTYFITWSTSRFARNRLDAQIYKRRLSKSGVTLVYAGMEIDRSSDGGWLTEGILELFDEFTSKQIAADTRRSMIKAAQSGYWCGGHAPFGYASVPAGDDPKRRRLAILDTEAATVRRIFVLRAQGVGSKTIALMLNQDGERNRQRSWNKTSVLGLLRNPAMIGQLVFGRMVRIDGERRRVAPENWINVPSHLPIIDRDLWDTVQRLLDVEAHNTQPIPESVVSGSPKSTHLFTGLLRCGVCGASLQIETAKGRSSRYSYYNCRNAQRNGGCPPRRIPARELDHWLLELICADLFTPAHLLQAIQDLQEMAGRWRIERAERRKTLEGQRQNLKRRNGRLYEVLEELGRDAPNLGDLAQRLRENNAKIKELEAQLLEIDNEPPPQIEIADEDLQAVSFELLETLKNGYNPAQARAFFAEFIEKIVVESASVRIEYHPHRLIGALPAVSATAVHSELIWLPGSGSLGTVQRLLPAHFVQRRRHG